MENPCVHRRPHLHHISNWPHTRLYSGGRCFCLQDIFLKKITFLFQSIFKVGLLDDIAVVIALLRTFFTSFSKPNPTQATRWSLLNVTLPKYKPLEKYKSLHLTNTPSNISAKSLLVGCGVAVLSQRLPLWSMYSWAGGCEYKKCGWIIGVPATTSAIMGGLLSIPPIEATPPFTVWELNHRRNYQQPTYLIYRVISFWASP